ncbi:MAG: beta-L-arabinofuranosidase domain-containing protein [bacterium]
MTTTAATAPKSRTANAIAPVLFNKVKIKGGFLGRRIETNRRVTLPIEYKQLKDTGRLDAWKLKWKPGQPKEPHIFWDSDVAKWMEAAAYSLTCHPDKALEKQLDDVIALMEKAQLKDGYLNTHYIAVEPKKRWTNLRDCHELYCAGHLAEAAVAHYHATGKRTFLDVMSRYADHISRTFGPRRGLKRGYCGHEEVELAMVKLYDATGNRRYLDLATYFVDERGRKPYYFTKEAIERGDDPKKMRHHTYEYCQAHAPVREQTKVVGHSVRAMYLYCAMADVAAANGDKTLLDACKTLWKSVTRGQMHVTGGIGPTASNEGFTTDYDMPTETAYLETCAAIGLVFWAHRMLQAEVDSEYADVMERALYNGVLSGVSTGGDTFFYGNPLAVYPGMNGLHYAGPGYHYRRSPWFGCACCPTNVVRLLASLGSYVYSTGHDELYVHLYANNRADIDIGGQKIAVVQDTSYPWDENVRLTISPRRAAVFTVSLRIPGWCRSARLTVNGKAMDVNASTRKGYVRINRLWNRGDSVELVLPMPVERVVANPKARQISGRVALMRGPVVYCLEQVDNGPELNDIRLPRSAKLSFKMDTGLFGGTIVVSGAGVRTGSAGWKNALYTARLPQYSKARITAVPYSLWANREPGEMVVWIRE